MVTDLNIYKYKYYVDFLTFKNKKAEAQARKLRRRK